MNVIQKELLNQATVFCATEVSYTLMYVPKTSEPLFAGYIISDSQDIHPQHQSQQQIKYTPEDDVFLIRQMKAMQDKTDQAV